MFEGSVQYLEEINFTTTEFGDLYDELPLWSARFGAVLLEQVELRRGMTILDVGAGTGFLSIELAQRCGLDATVIAVDPWEAALARLTRKVKHLGIQNISTVAKDVAAIDLPDASVDLIVSNLGLNNFEKREAALRSCFRAAKPGANLFLTTNLFGHMAEFYDAYRSVLLDLGFAERIAALDNHINDRATVRSTRSLLEQAGFEFVKADTFSFHERFVDGSAMLRHHFIRLGFMPAWKAVAPKGELERTFNALQRKLNSIAEKHGELSLTVPAACVQARKP